MNVTGEILRKKIFEKRYTVVLTVIQTFLVAGKMLVSAVAIGMYIAVVIHFSVRPEHSAWASWVICVCVCERRREQERMKLCLGPVREVIADFWAAVVLISTRSDSSEGWKFIYLFIFCWGLWTIRILNLFTGSYMLLILVFLSWYALIVSLIIIISLSKRGGWKKEDSKESNISNLCMSITL